MMQNVQYVLGVKNLETTTRTRIVIEGFRGEARAGRGEQEVDFKDGEQMKI